MNLEKLFQMQKALDAKIIKEKGLEGQDLLPNTILALQVELGELANEWRGFKHWSNDREPRTKKLRVKSWGTGIGGTNESEEYNPLLEEYVDCLHFVLSIGLQKEFDYNNFEYLHELNIDLFHNSQGIIEQFNDVFGAIYEFKEKDENVELYEDIFLCLIALGEMLGFTWEQVEQAYMDKNAVNHERQANGY